MREKKIGYDFLLHPISKIMYWTRELKSSHKRLIARMESVLEKAVPTRIV